MVGLNAGESFKQAAHRELLEETGVEAEQVGPWVWTRRHAYSLNGQWCDQYERFFVARTSEARVQPLRQDSYVRSYRWWTLQDLAVATDDFRTAPSAGVVAERRTRRVSRPPDRLWRLIRV